MALYLKNMYNFDQHVEHLYQFQPSEDLTESENERLRLVCI